LEGRAYKPNDEYDEEYSRLILFPAVPQIQSFGGMQTYSFVPVSICDEGKVLFNTDEHG